MGSYYFRPNTDLEKNLFSETHVNQGLIVFLHETLILTPIPVVFRCPITNDPQSLC